MQLRIMTEPQQGATYAELLAVAQESERLGFDAFFRSDHLLRTGEGDLGPGSTEAWATLAGLARETSRMRLGTMVSSATFRTPGMLALTVATVDAMSGGRVELGLGTGWYAAEHEAFGVEFPDTGVRFERFEEQLEIVTGLWATAPDATFSYDGRHYQLRDNPGLPKPAQSPRPPIVIGGTGPRRTPRLAAAFADEYNVPFRSVDDTAEAYARVRAACEQAGRDPGSMVYSTAQSLLIGRDEADLTRKIEQVGLKRSSECDAGLVGTPGEVVDKIGRFTEAGATRVYLQLQDLQDLDQLSLVADQVRS
ncbi:MAG TPA: LLM class F420-dependent oxidoreductase [Propionibacteriaceae bacterium]|nr:LLM class F420-dependent oxidoreductase [Propionibacteriaceae bacterium]